MEFGLKYSSHSPLYDSKKYNQFLLAAHDMTGNLQQLSATTNLNSDKVSAALININKKQCEKIPE